ncbi:MULTISPECIES: ArgS-related anticodon-binding protein NrtL [Streptomyces]
MTPVELSRTVLRAMRGAVDDGELGGLGDLSGVERLSGLEGSGTGGQAWRVVVERPRPGGCGDYATNVALQVARAAGQSPRRVAEVLSPRIAAEPGIAAIDITGPGFLNITLARDAGDARDAGTAGDALGSGDARGSADARDARASGAPADATYPRGTSAALVREVLDRGSLYGHAPDAPAEPALHPAPATPHNPRSHGSHNPRAAALADSLHRILRSQGTPLRPTHGEPSNEAERPAPLPVAVPAPADPVPLPAAVPAPADPAPLPVAVPAPADPVPLPAAVPAPADPAPLGPDAARWALLSPAVHDRPRISDEHLVQRASNPLFRVRYAHSRARALTRNAADLGFTGVPGDLAGPIGGGIPPYGQDLLDALADYPRVLAAAARHRAPDRLARHLVVTADALLGFQPAVLPIGDEKPSAAHRARLALAEAAGTVLAGGLSLLGISAPAYL